MVRAGASAAGDEGNALLEGQVHARLFGVHRFRPVQLGEKVLQVRIGKSVTLAMLPRAYARLRYIVGVGTRRPLTRPFGVATLVAITGTRKTLFLPTWPPVFTLTAACCHRIGRKGA